MGSRLWPRGCALAERLWSDPEGADVWREAEQRLLEHRRRMAVVRGIQADVVQPEFCRQVWPLSHFLMVTKTNLQKSITLILNFKGQQLEGSTVKLFAKIRVSSGL